MWFFLQPRSSPTQLPSVGQQHEGVRKDDHDGAQDERDGRRVVVLLVGEGQRVGVEVGGVVVTDDLRRDREHDSRFGEELQRAYYGEDDRQKDGRPYHRHLDVEGYLPPLCPIHGRRVVHLGGQGLQRRVHDDHVVAGERPGDDVRDGGQHPTVGEKVWRGEIQKLGELRERPEGWTVEIA